jgi:PAS domain S-box-containing protein
VIGQAGARPAAEGRHRIGDRSEHAADEKYRLFAEATEEGIVIHDFVRVLAVNSHLGRMFGYAEADIVGADPFRLIVPTEPISAEATLSDEGEIANETLGVRADGGIFPVALRGRTVTYQGKQARLVRIRDLTRQRQAEATLSASEERFAQPSNRPPSASPMSRPTALGSGSIGGYAISSATRTESC